MPEKEKTERVILKVVEEKPGVWIMKYCKQQWRTCPFVWPSEASAIKDMSLVVAALLKQGYVVVDNDGQEVKTE